MAHTKAVTLFAALAHPLRVRLLYQLRYQGPMPIMELTDGTGVTRQAISRHLDVMEVAGLVRSAPSGRERWYDIDTSSVPPKIMRSITAIIDAI